MLDDLGVGVRGYMAWNLSTLGWPDRSIVRAREAVALARELDHPFSLAHALFFETGAHYLRRDFTAQRECAAETIALSEAHGFQQYLGVGRTFHAAARVAAGESEAIADLLAGLGLTAGTGFKVGAPCLFALLGEAYMTAGQLTEARGAVETGLAVATQMGQPCFDSELHRLQGEIVLNAGGSPSEAEAFFHHALEIARAQEAKSFELRTAITLARLWRDQGKRAAARNFLAPLHAWFTEGLDTADLKDAKALLDELNA
jgi:hypothetical protein